MARVRIDVGDFPKGVREGLARWRAKGSNAPWATLGRFSTREATFDVPYSGQAEIDVYPIDPKTSAQGRSRTAVVDTTGKVADLEAPKSQTYPAAAVTYSDGVISVTPKAPDGAVTESAKATMTFHVRISEPEESAVQAVLVGEVKAGETIKVNAWGVDNQTIHVQPFRDVDGAHGTIAATTIQTPVAPPDHVTVTDDAGTSLAGWTFDAINGHTPLEFSTGLRNAACRSFWNTTDTASIWGKTADPPIWAVRTYYPLGTVTSPAFDGGVVHEFLPCILPEFGSLLQAPAPSIWGRTADRRMTHRHREDPTDTGDFRGDKYDRRERTRDGCPWNTAGNGDVGPIELEKEISLSQDAAAYADFIPLVEGTYYRARAYKLRARLRSRKGRKRTVLSKLRVRRWIRNKKWEFTPALSLSIRTMTYTFSPVPEIVAGMTVSVQVLDATPPANTVYDVLVKSVSTTQVVFDVWEVDTTTGIGATPTVTDQVAHIILTGY